MVMTVHKESDKFLNVLFSKTSFNTTQFCIIKIKCFFLYFLKVNTNNLEFDIMIFLKTLNS